MHLLCVTYLKLRCHLRLQWCNAIMLVIAHLRLQIVAENLNHFYNLFISSVPAREARISLPTCLSHLIMASFARTLRDVTTSLKLREGTGVLALVDTPRSSPDISLQIHIKSLLPHCFSTTRFAISSFLPILENARPLHRLYRQVG